MPVRHGDQVARLVYNAPIVADFWKPAADAAAGTTTAETVFYVAPVNMTVTSCDVVPSAALTAADATAATITVRRRNADGTSAATIASIVTNLASGNWTQWVSKALTLGAGTAITAGQIMTLEIAKAGAGTAVPAGVVRVVAIRD